MQDDSTMEQPVPSLRAGHHARTRDDLVYATLCGVIFVAGLLSNNGLVLICETVFLLLLVSASGFGRLMAASDRRLLAVFLFWAVAVTVAFLASPYNVIGTTHGVMRYGQTIMHVVFFLAVLAFLRVRAGPLGGPLVAITAASLLVAVTMGLMLWQLAASGRLGEVDWFNSPPFHGHIRHAGYLMTAGLCVAMMYVAPNRFPAARKLAAWAAAIVLFTALLWMGGRSSILAVGVTFVALAVALQLQGRKTRHLWIRFLAALVVGLVVSEAIAVFPWNGLAQSWTRSVEATSLAAAGTGRLNIWLSTLETFLDHPVFGVGPGGYADMPNHIYGLQPHSVILQLLIEWGVVGALLFLGLLTYGFAVGLKRHFLSGRSHPDWSANGALAVVLGLTIHGLFDGTYFHPQPSMYLAVAFAVWIAAFSRRPADVAAV